MCAPFVWLSYVQPSRGKTFAYLRSFALPYEATVLGRRDEPNAEREEGAGKDVPSPGPSSSAKRDLPEKRAVLSWPPATPQLYAGVLTGCPANRIYRTAWPLSNAPT